MWGTVSQVEGSVCVTNAVHYRMVIASQEGAGADRYREGSAHGNGMAWPLSNVEVKSMGSALDFCDAKTFSVIIRSHRNCHRAFIVIINNAMPAIVYSKRAEGCKQLSTELLQ